MTEELNDQVEQEEVSLDIDVQPEEVKTVKKEVTHKRQDPTADEIKLELHYRDQFDIARKTTKHIDIFIP